MCFGVKRFLAGLLLLQALAWGKSPAQPASQWTLRHQPARIVNGSPVFLQVTAPKGVRRLTGKWLQHEIAFNFDAAQKSWFALAGASQETSPGEYPVELQGETASGEKLTFRSEIRIFRQRYPKVTLTVPNRYTAPDPEQQRVIAHDKDVKTDVFKIVSADREWSGSFEPPVKAEISDVFGVQRVFNGKVQSTHQGLDFRVPAGTPVEAVNAGTVILAQSLYFEGNCVMIDHGQGLITIYMHLSELRVKQGDHVRKGQLVGLSGGTGRATGPHLHLAVRWQGVYVNPAGLLALRLP
jgi:murein DD-endopeptidase MepM/ murein hydrolase activator NlpD